MIKDLSEAAYGQKWIKTAPLIIVLCTELVEKQAGGRWIQEKRFPDKVTAIRQMQDLYEYLNLKEHQTKIPATHMTLQALEHGIYSTMVSYFEVDKVAKLLKVTWPIIPSEILVLGYPNEDLKPRDKKKLDDLVTYVE